MIAIAGAKGGCGKTTTTLGLARAFDRDGRPSFVIDGDQQLPNVHVAAGVDRDPTVAALQDGDDTSEVAQPLPDAARAGVLTAPQDPDLVDLASLLDRVPTGVESFVDCPAGAGPDAAEPISAADVVVIVTTGTERSLTSAAKTADMARELDTPVAGAVVNKCDEVPLAFQSTFDVPLLGRVPPCQSPQQDHRARAAYDHIAAELLSRLEAPPAPPEFQQIRLPLGLETVDRELGGGIPAGSVVAFSADPGAPSELLLHATTRARGTLYLTVDQSCEEIRAALSDSVVQTGDPTIRKLEGPSMLADAKALLRRLPSQVNVIVDTMDRLEQHDQEAYRDFLGTLSDAVATTDSIALLHTLDRSPTPRNRVTTERFADLVLRVDREQSGSATSYRFSVPKTEADEMITPSDGIDLTDTFSGRRSALNDD
ncbi:DUF7125 family protein [Haloarcula salinisoli]|uniref:CobQ/CobB/MinD/ParA nucleotide binding domain-containing protein n=1 Tax=Haloarcula salinisoli TaxID=2487746 RepID=A0A8J7YL53_9EURY|nr:AAA family ATPase [Halomicroarcula salinisoli]MBX0288068.1 hypothetical protein [Halomicroarcula salinisoli]MBX0305199.1 hypothetical protein [Halomicroarcula salinisoli]